MLVVLAIFKQLGLRASFNLHKSFILMKRTPFKNSNGVSKFILGC